MRRRRVQNVVGVCVVLLFCTACASAPPQLTPRQARIWQANEMAIAIGSVQSAAIGLNKIQQCTPLCHPLLSDTNTRIVIEIARDGLQSLRAVPEGWKATGLAVAGRIRLRLDEAGRSKMAAYLTACTAIANRLL